MVHRRGAVVFYFFCTHTANRNLSLYSSRYVVCLIRLYAVNVAGAGVVATARRNVSQEAHASRFVVGVCRGFVDIPLHYLKIFVGWVLVGVERWE